MAKKKPKKQLPSALTLLMEKHEAASERAKHARSFIRKTRGFKYSNKEVLEFRLLYLASSRVKGVSLKIVAALCQIPMSTMLSIIYKKGYRAVTEATPQGDENLAPYVARLETLMVKHGEAVKAVKRNKLNAREAGYTLKQKHQLLSSTASKVDVPAEQPTVEPEIDYHSLSPMQQVIHDNLEFISRDQIIYAVQEWMRGNGKSCPSILGQLVTQISRSTGVNA